MRCEKISILEIVLLKAYNTNPMSSPEIKTDILVVGAGPAGLSVAEKTARNFDTLIIDEKTEIGHPVCSTGGSFISDLKQLSVPSDLYHPIHQARLISPNNSTLINFNEPVICIMDVTETYRFLADRARKAGAKIQMRTRGIRPLINNNHIIGAVINETYGADREIFSKVLVDSTGHRSTMLRQTNLNPKFKRFGVGVEYDMDAPYCDPDEIVVVMDSKVAPHGYAWIAPWGKGRVRVGIGIVHPDSREDPKKYLDNFINNMSKYNVNLKGCRINEQHFGLIPSDGLAKTFVGNGIIGVGDSVGQVSSLIGEGIRLSIEAGILAGETIIKNGTKKDLSSSSLKEYQAIWKKRHEVQLFISSKANKIVRSASNNQLDSGVELMKLIPAKEISEILHTGFNIKHGKLLIVAIPQILKETKKNISIFK
jgi:digeranylgeranylglycerophospholipid reductase